MERPADTEYRGYVTRGQVAGYFDGDGSILFTVRKYTLYFAMEWADTSRAQLEQIRAFLRRSAVYCAPKILTVKGRYVSYSLLVNFQDSILRLAKSMVKYTYKKRAELRGVIDYLENRITGNQLIEIFNNSVRDGTRAGIMRELTVPYTRFEGLQMARTIGPRRSGVARRKLSPEQISSIKQEHMRGKSIGELAREHKVSTSTISKAVNSY